MDRTVQFAIDLIEMESVTPKDGGCQETLASRLEAAVALGYLAKLNH